MSVRAKFKVTRIEASTGSRAQRDADGNILKDERGYQKNETCEMRTVVLSTVYSPDPNSENGKFWAASPSGEVRLGTINPEAWSRFELDKEYFLDFTPA